MMKLLFFLYLCVSFALAESNLPSSSIDIDDNRTIPTNGSDYIVDTFSEGSVDLHTSNDNYNVDLNHKVDTSSTSMNEDEKLKNEIITFDRIGYVNDELKIGDPFIYIYPQSKDDMEVYMKAEQAVLVLNGIFENKASINNIWVGKNDVVEGWIVSDIKKDRVELKFGNKAKVLYVNTNSNGVKIK